MGETNYMLIICDYNDSIITVGQFNPGAEADAARIRFENNPESSPG